MKPHFVHIKDRCRDGKVRTWWVVGDDQHTMCGRIGETQFGLSIRWEAKHGKPVGGYIRIEGYCTLPVAAATLGNLKAQREIREERERTGGFDGSEVLS